MKNMKKKMGIGKAKMVAIAKKNAATRKDEMRGNVTAAEPSVACENMAGKKY